MLKGEEQSHGRGQNGASREKGEESNHTVRTRAVAQGVGCLPSLHETRYLIVSQHDINSLILRSHIVEGKNQLQVSSDLHTHKNKL